MTIVGTCVCIAGQSFITNYCAKMFAFRIPKSTKFSVSRTTKLSAFMLFAGLEFVTYTIASKIVNLLNLLWTHQLIPFCFRVVDLVAG